MGQGCTGLGAALVGRLLDGGEYPTTTIANGSDKNITKPALALVGLFAWMHSLARPCGRSTDGLNVIKRGASVVRDR